MKIIKTKGIVLKTIPYSESSCITKIYTESLGLISCIVRGAKRSSAKIRKPLFNELSILDLVLREPKKSSLYNIYEAKINYNYQFLNTNKPDLIKNCIFLFINEFLLKIINEASQSTEFFNYIYNSLKQLDSSEKVSPEFHIIFMMKVMQFLGINISFESYSDDQVLDIKEGYLTKHYNVSNYDLVIPEAYVQIMYIATLSNNNDRIAKCKSAEIRRQTTDYILLFYKYHYPAIKELKSIDIFKELLI